MSEYQIHPAANIFPMCSPEDYEVLKGSIKEFGLKHRIALWDEGGPVIDGRNRLKACTELGITPAFRAVDPEVEGDPVDYVLRENLHRRHLTISQRGAAAVKAVNVKLGDNQHTEGTPHGVPKTSQPIAAQMFDVSLRTVQRASKVDEKGAPELFEAVAKGDLKMAVAERIIDVFPNDHAAQVEAIKQPPPAPPRPARPRRHR